MAQFNLAIELGTSNTVIYAAGLGVALKEPSCIAIETVNNKKVVKCVGIDAKKLIGKTNNSIEVFFPIVEGVIANFQLAKLMLKEFLKKVAPSGFGKPKKRVVFIHACGLTREEKNKIRDLAYALNITSAALIPCGVCALSGNIVEAQLAIQEAKRLQMSTTVKVCLLATEGLTEFRIGNIEEGRELYARAIQLAKTSSNDSHLINTAILNFIREEVRANKDFDKSYLEVINKIPDDCKETIQLKKDIQFEIGLSMWLPYQH